MKFGRKDYDRRIIDQDNKIPTDEPVFLLRAQDSLAPRLLLMWAMELRLRGGDPQMASNAEAHAQLMIDWQSRNSSRVKTPDSYKDSEGRSLILKQINQVLDNLQEGKKIDFHKLSLLVAEYCNSDESIVILTKTDLYPQFRMASVHAISKTHFDLSPEVELSYAKAKLVIYATSEKCIILKNELNNETNVD